MILMTINIKF